MELRLRRFVGLVLVVWMLAVALAVLAVIWLPAWMQSVLAVGLVLLLIARGAPVAQRTRYRRVRG